MLLRQPLVDRHHIPGQADEAQKLNGQIGNVEFPPAMAMRRAAWLRVMIIVPAFAIAEEADQDVVAAILIGGIIAIAPQMGCGIDRPGDVPDQDGADEDAPDQQAQTELNRAK